MTKDEEIRELRTQVAGLSQGLRNALVLIQHADPNAWNNGNTHGGFDEGGVISSRMESRIEKYLASTITTARRWEAEVRAGAFEEASKVFRQQDGANPSNYMPISIQEKLMDLAQAERRKSEGK